MIAISSYVVVGRNGFFEEKSDKRLDLLKKDVDIMVENKKCLEYYLDSRIYDKEEIEKNIEETKKEFPKKEIEVQVELNEWGVYIITFYFKDKKKKKEKTEFSYIFENVDRKQDKNKTYLEPRIYGQYKATKTYKPY